jgi:signal transduction histidine kinase
MYLSVDLYNFNSAILRAKEALSLAEEVNVLTYKVDATKIIADSYQDLKDFSNATEYYNKYISYREKLFEIEQNRQIIELETQYQTKENEIVIAQITTEEATQRKLNLYFIVGLGIAGVFIIVMVMLLMQIRKSNKYIQSQNSQLADLNDTKNKFFSIVAHDLRSPIIALQGVGQKLDYFIKKDMQEKLLEMGNRIDQSIDQLNHLLNNLLNWASQETGGMPFHPDTIASKDVVKEAMGLYKSIADVRNITIETKFEDAAIYGDKNMIGTVLRNLISNALKFTEAEGTVEISTEVGEGFSLIHIIDNGKGMSQQEVDGLFAR